MAVPPLWQTRLTPAGEAALLVFVAHNILVGGLAIFAVFWPGSVPGQFDAALHKIAICLVWIGGSLALAPFLFLWRRIESEPPPIPTPLPQRQTLHR